MLLARDPGSALLEAANQKSHFVCSVLTQDAKTFGVLFALDIQTLGTPESIGKLIFSRVSNPCVTR